MKKKLLYSLLFLLIISFAWALYLLQPSGDIQAYSSHFAPQAKTLQKGQVRVTFLGVSTLLFDDGDTQILIDGYFSRPSMWQLLTAPVASDTALINGFVKAFGMHRVKGIFVTHSHFDHAFDVAYTAKRTQATLYGSISTLNIGHGGGVPEGQLALFQPYQKVKLGDFTVQVIPSKHSHPNTLNDDGVMIRKPLPQPARMRAYSEGGSYDFWISHPKGSIYIKPSANYIEGRLDTLRADVLMTGIATIAKQPAEWQNHFYEQTVGKLKPKLVIPLHWDDFFQPISEHLTLLPRFANDTPADFDFMIHKTSVDAIDFKILQGTKSMVLFQNP